MTFPDATPYYTPGAGTPGPPGPPGPGGSRFIVPNEAAASALAGTVDGDEIFILSHMSSWRAAPPGSEGSAIPLQPHAVIARAGGGTLLRGTYSDPAWRIGRDSWFIDPIAGNDEATGLTLPTAIQTGAEFLRRWGRTNLVQQSGGAPDFSVTINIVSDILSPDFLEIDCVVAGDTELRIVGVVSSTAPAAAAAVTAENQPANIPWDVTFGAAVAPGDRVRDLSGANLNAVLWALKVLAAGNQRRVSQLSLNTESSFGVLPVDKTPVAGDLFVVDTIPKVNMSAIRVRQQSDFFGFGASVNVLDLEITNAGATTLTALPGVESSLNQVQFVFYQCRFTCPVESFSGSSFSNCLFFNPPNKPNIFHAGTFAYGGGSLDTPLEWFSEGEGQIQNNFYIQGGGASGAFNTCLQCTLGNVSVWDSPAAGIEIGEPNGATSNNGLGSVKAADRLWGAGNAGPGIQIRSGSKLAYNPATPPTITGAGGDFTLGGSAIAQWGDVATGTYQPPGGLALTWTNLAAAAGVAGFGTQAHHLPSDTHIMTVS